MYIDIITDCAYDKIINYNRGYLASVEDYLENL